DPAVLQCFDADELKRCRYELGTRLKLAQLAEPSSTPPPTRDLAAVAEYAEIWAPHYSALVERSADGPGRLAGSWEVAKAAREAGRVGLELHPYTFRLDAVPAEFDSLEQQLEFFFRQVGV